MAKHGARNVRVFGSFARGEQKPSSDIDLLVDMDPGRTLLDLIGLQLDLEDALSRKVEVITETGLSPHLREKILADAVRL